ncbi:MAG: VCBS repeat-containing protein [Phaeodactylibacter sp.]|nr:VCBS repeat-containing protein [Phaeodactylibacter sp.]
MKKTALYILLITIIGSCQNRLDLGNDSAAIKLFELIPPEQSGIDFNNFIVENRTVNYFVFMQLYMGAGIAVGDINNDGLPDLYFNSNFGQNKLYLNRGNLQFEDITEAAGVGANEGFRTGANMVDINDDGFLDIYICRSGWYKEDFIKRNLLYINNGDATFTESAKNYGLDDPRNSIQSTFFDYDKDGDLDMFLINTTTDFSYTRKMGKMDYFHQEEGFKALNSNDILYQNNGDGTFADVSAAAGILSDIGFGLSVLSADFNDDGWTDVFIGNDFVTPDYLYINQGDGTFREQSKEYFKHTSLFSMGSDAADINNDGLTDLFVLDMMPKDYKRSKTSMAMVDPVAFKKSIEWGYNYQYGHNMLQLNNGGNQGRPEQVVPFSEISQLAGVSKSDWSWAGHLADFDNDGYKDIYITNGLKKYVTDQDFAAKIEERYRTQNYPEKIEDLLNDLPSGEAKNFMYRNDGNGLAFSDYSTTWGLDTLSFSNGCVVADLDNDGDLDIVTNNSDSKAFLFENKSEKLENGYLRINLKGSKQVKPRNAKAYLKDGNGKILQFQEAIVTRGYLSNSESTLHFGTGRLTEIPLVEVVWLDGQVSRLENVATNQVLAIDYKTAQPAAKPQSPATPYFTEKTSSIIPPFVHQENEFDDFKNQVLLPHRESANGPSLAVGDVNGDGLEDFFVGGATRQAGCLYLQYQNGSFSKSNQPAFEKDNNYEDVGALLFDADQDGDNDLYVVSGGSEFGATGQEYQDRLYLNNNGAFSLAVAALPVINASGGSVAAADYDQDGDLDLFVGGRILPDQYPFTPKSYLLRNDRGKFAEATTAEMQEIGMVADAIWADADGDQDDDLIVVGEWMRIEVFKNNGGLLQLATEDLGLSQTRGWWNRIAAHDIDGDGDLDFIAGNLGLNYKFHTSPEKPFKVYAGDFDKNGTVEIVLTKEVQGDYMPIRGKTCSSVQTPSLKEKFPTFSAFADANVLQIYGAENIKEAFTYEAHIFESVMLINEGGRFRIINLPIEAQMFPLKGIVVTDVNQDNIKDLVLGGNHYAAEVETTRADAGIGLVLQADKNGNFQQLTVSQSGFFVPNDVINMKRISLAGGKTGILVVNNNGALQLFQYTLNLQ